MDRRATAALPLAPTALLGALLLLLGCYGDVTGPLVAPPDLEQLAGLDAQAGFDVVAADAQVPAELLVAIAWKSSALSPLDGGHGEHFAAHGWLGLNEDQLAETVDLTGLTAEQITQDRDASMVAGAALLDRVRNDVAPHALGWSADQNWWPVLVAWSDLEEPWAAQQYAADIFAILQKGLITRTWDGDIVTIEPRAIPGLASIVLDPPPGSEERSDVVDYPGAAHFVPAHSSNWSSRSGGTSAIDKVVIHTTEGSYEGAISWFRNSSSDVSAHYVIRKSDGEVTQMVRDADRAWHAAGGNADSIGIEHEGAAANAATWTQAMLESSARLSAHLSATYDIPIDRDHFIGHNEVPATLGSRTDPGAHFPWGQYMQLVQCFRFGGGPDCAEGVADGDVGDDGQVDFDLADVVDAVGSDVPIPGGGSACGSCESSGSCSSCSSSSACSTCSGSGSVDGAPCGTCGGDGGCTSCDASGDCTVCGGDGSFDGGSDDDGSIDPEDDATGKVDWLAPQPGDLIGSDPLLSAEHDGGASRIEFWSGPGALGGSTANPANVEASFPEAGPRTLTVKTTSPTGLVLDSESINVEVADTVEGGIELHGSPAGGLTWQLSASVTISPIATVRYTLDGSLLTDDATGAPEGMGHDYSLTHTFDTEGKHHLLKAQGFGADGTTLLAEDWMFIDIVQSAPGECPIIETIECGSVVVGSTTGPEASDIHDHYPEIVGNWSGPEVGYAWFSGGQSRVDVGFVAGESTQLDLDIIVLEDAGQQCLAEDATQVVFNSLELEVQPGTWYTFVVDGYDGAAGEFSLQLECDVGR